MQTFALNPVNDREADQTAFSQFQLSGGLSSGFKTVCAGRLSVKQLLFEGEFRDQFAASFRDAHHLFEFDALFGTLFADIAFH